MANPHQNQFLSIVYLYLISICNNNDKLNSCPPQAGVIKSVSFFIWIRHKRPQRTHPECFFECNEKKYIERQNTIKIY